TSCLEGVEQLFLGESSEVAARSARRAESSYSSVATGAARALIGNTPNTELSHHPWCKRSAPSMARGFLIRTRHLGRSQRPYASRDVATTALALWPSWERKSFPPVTELQLCPCVELFAQCGIPPPKEISGFLESTWRRRVSAIEFSRRSFEKQPGCGYNESSLSETFSLEKGAFRA